MTGALAPGGAEPGQAGPARPGGVTPLWVLQVVTISRPQPAVVAASLPPRVAITARWPPRRVTQPCPPPAPRVIRPAAPPQGPWRLAIPPGHPLRNMDLYDLPPRKDVTR